MDLLFREQLWKDALGQRAVFQHVRRARRDPQVVLEHVDRTVLVAHQVRPTDVGPDAELRTNAATRLKVVLRTRQELCRKDLSLQHALLVVNVIDELIQRTQTLLQASRDALPLALSNHARDDVEWPFAIDFVALRVDREGDSERANRRFGCLLSHAQFIDAEPSEQFSGGAHAVPRQSRGAEQLIETGAGIILEHARAPTQHPSHEPAARKSAQIEPETRAQHANFALERRGFAERARSLEPTKTLRQLSSERGQAGETSDAEHESCAGPRRPWSRGRTARCRTRSQAGGNRVIGPPDPLRTSQAQDLRLGAESAQRWPRRGSGPERRHLA